MSIPLYCPLCGHSGQVRDRLQGVRVYCPRCDKPIRAGVMSETEEAAADEEKRREESRKRYPIAKVPKPEPKPNWNTISTKQHVVILLALVAAIAFFIFRKPSTPAKPTKEDAWRAAQHFVAELLRSPSTASFGRQDPEKCVTDLGNGKFEVRGWVDGQNAFGAVVRADFKVKVSHVTSDQWLLVDLPSLTER